SKETFELKTNKEVVVMTNPLGFTSEQKSDLTHNNIIFVGRFDYSVKGLDYLVEIMSHLKSLNNNFKLTIVGDGSKIENKRLRDDVLNHNLQDNVEFVGSTDNV